MSDIADQPTTKKNLTREEQKALIIKIEARVTSGQKTEAACEAEGVKSANFYYWRKQLTGGGSTSQKQKTHVEELTESDEPITPDQLVDALLEDDLDDWYEEWRGRAVRLIESGKPGPVKSGQLIEEMLISLGHQLGWDVED